MKKMRGFSIFLVFLYFLSTSMAMGDEFCVRTSAELQSALTQAASNGEDDVIRVVRGTYIGNFTFDSWEGKDLTLLGGFSSGCINRTVNPDNTILDGNFSGRVLYLNNSSGGNLFVEGFKLRRGRTLEDGGGLYAASYSFMMAGDITIQDNVMLDNSAANGSGLYVWTSNEEGSWKATGIAHGKNLSFPIQKKWGNDGSEIESDGTGDILIVQNKVKNNLGDGLCAVTGGELVGGTLIIQDNLVVRNSGRGIVAYSFAGSMWIESNYISKNTSTKDGGGIYARATLYLGTGGNMWLKNNMITENSSVNGGGIYAIAAGDMIAGHLDLINNTITDNSCSNSGGGIYLEGQLDSVINVYNNIIWGNSALTGGDVRLVYDTADWAEAHGFNNDFSLISGSWTQSGQNINADPLFADPVNDDYHLQYCVYRRGAYLCAHPPRGEYRDLVSPDQSGQ